MTTLLSLLFLILSVSGYALAQVTCSGAGQSLVCVGPTGTPTIQQQLNSNTGVVIAVTPYTILTPPQTPAPGLIVPAIPVPRTMTSNSVRSMVIMVVSPFNKQIS